MIPFLKEMSHYLRWLVWLGLTGLEGLTDMWRR